MAKKKYTRGRKKEDREKEEKEEKKSKGEREEKQEEKEEQEKEKAAKPDTRQGDTGSDTGSDTGQPPPPEQGGSGGELPWEHEHEHEDEHEHEHGKHKHKHHDHDHHHHIDHEAAEVIYRQLLEVRKTVAALVQETKDAKLRKRLERVPVRTSDLMRGFQAAVARANRAARSGDEGGEDIERMSIKDLEISLSAPIIEGGHADDPVLMLPNIKSAETEAAAVSLKFTVVSVPLKQRG